MLKINAIEQLKMKIERYPGKAIDASLALDRNNVLVELYEANWYQTQQNCLQREKSAMDSLQVSSAANVSEINSMYNSLSQPKRLAAGNAGRSGKCFGSYLVDGISTLRRYQMSLEQINLPEQNYPNDLQADYINSNSSLNRINSIPTHTIRNRSNGICAKNTDLFDDDLTSAPLSLNPATVEKRSFKPRQQISIKPPALKRSQTMVVYNRRQAPLEDHLINTSDCRTDVVDTSSYVISKKQPSQTSQLELPATELSASARLNPFVKNSSHFGLQRTKSSAKPNLLKTSSNEKQEDCDTNSNHSILTSGKNSLTVEPRPVLRSKSMRFPILFKSSTDQSVNSSGGDKALSARKVLLSRFLSRRNNHKNLEEETNRVNKSDSNEVVTKSLQKLYLHNPTLPQVHKEVSPTNKSPACLNSNSTSPRQSAQISNNISNSESNGNSDQFFIPRPKLIVPVHTYARKRRTGNLHDQDQSSLPVIPTIPTRDSKTNNGEKTCDFA